jgi:hypothetical protein
MIASAVADGTIQVVAAVVTAIVVLLLTYSAAYIRRVNRTVNKVEKQTNGIQATQFQAVRDDIAELKRDIHEVSNLRAQVATLQTAVDLIKLVLPPRPPE